MTALLDAATLDAALEDLRALVRIDTTNPPGNEQPAIDYLANRLRSAGLDPVILHSEGRPNLVCRIAGDGTGGGPLLLAGHVDVVPVDRQHWTQDPFAGDIVGGYLYGRGTIDMKHAVVQALTVMLQIAASGRTPTRDIIFCAVSDEEAGCTHGSRFLVDQHPDLVRAEYMLGEFGGFSQDVAGVRYYPIQVAEKGVCQFRLTATGEPGHGSIPHKENAIVRLSRALQILGTTRLKHRIHPAAEAFVRGLAVHQKAPNKWVLPLLLQPAMWQTVVDRLIPESSVANTMAANMANTVSPTMLEGGAFRNVIPSAASAVLDGRLLPGQTRDDLFDEVRGLIGSDFTFEVLSYTPGRYTEGFADDPLYQAICQNVRDTDPGCHPLPYMITGFTDAKEFGRLGIKCYGYSPVRFPAADDIRFAKLVHGHDERIHVEGYRWGTDAFWRLVSGFVGLR